MSLGLKELLLAKLEKLFHIKRNLDEGSKARTQTAGRSALDGARTGSKQLSKEEESALLESLKR